MTAPLTSFDLLEDSSRLIAVLEQHRSGLPFAADALAQHRVLHRELQHQRFSSERALEEWRQALAQRWQCEVAGRRLYLIIQRQLVGHFGAGAPELLLFLRGGESDSSAPELCTDLRRLHAALSITRNVPPEALDLLAELAHCCSELEQAIENTVRCGQQRHRAMLERHLSQHAYQRVRSQTQRLINEHLGEWVELEMDDE